MPKDNLLLTIADAARSAGCGYWALWDALTRGDLTYVQRGRHLYVHPDDVQRWLRERPAEPAGR